MIEFVVDEEREKEICEFETKMLMKYKEAVVSYVPLFEKEGCELKLEIGWCNTICKTWSASRIPLRNGYVCYAYCLIKRGGKEVRIKSYDGETDYYPLETSWMISSVNRRLHKLKISLYKDLEDVGTEVEKLLLQLRYLE